MGRAVRESAGSLWRDTGRLPAALPRVSKAAPLRRENAGVQVSDVIFDGSLEIS